MIQNKQTKVVHSNIFSISRCELRVDAEDDCCSVMFCPDPDAKESDLLRPVSLPFEGCLFKNATYNQGERFYDGCEQQCQCMGYGDMVCVSRCPPTAPAPGQNCYTLPDASDPCCNITVCDKPFLDPSQNVRKKEEDSEDENELRPFVDVGRITVEENDDTTTQASQDREEVEEAEEKTSRIINNPVFSQNIPGKKKKTFFPRFFLCLLF